MKIKSSLPLIALIIGCLVFSVQNSIVDILEELDSKIVKTFQNPATQTGDELLTTLDNYNSNFTYLVQLLHEENEKGTDVIHKLAKLIWSKGGPEFLNVTFDNELLKRTYSWNNEMLKSMYFYLGTTRIIWADIKELNPDNPSFRIPTRLTKDLLELDKNGLLNDLLQYANRCANRTIVIARV